MLSSMTPAFNHDRIVYANPIVITSSHNGRDIAMSPPKEKSLLNSADIREIESMSASCRYSSLFLYQY